LGRVVDLTGAPVHGVRVVAREADCERELGVADARGCFPWSSDVLAECLLVDDPKWVAVLTCDPRFARGGRARTIVVAPTATVRGVVVSNGIGVSSARVGLSVDLAELGSRFDPTLAPAPLELSRGVDAEGRFEFAAAPRIDALTLRASSRGFTPRAVELDLARLDGLAIELLPVPDTFGVLRGRIVRANGEAASSEASVTWGSNSVRANADGSFELALAIDPSGAPIEVRERGSTSASWPARLENLTSAPVELALGPPLEALHGRIAVSDGARLKGCVVRLYRDADRTRLAKTTRVDAFGRYAFEGLEPGEYWLTANAEDVEASLGPIPSGRRADDWLISR